MHHKQEVTMHTFWMLEASIKEPTEGCPTEDRSGFASLDDVGGALLRSSRELSCLGSWSGEESCGPGWVMLELTNCNGDSKFQKIRQQELRLHRSSKKPYNRNPG